MTSLSDLFESKSILSSFEAAPDNDFSPIPAGEYVAETYKGELGKSSNGNPYYKIQWRITEGDYENRFLFQSLYFTEKAGPRTKRDLAKIGITEDAQLEKAIPDFSCKLKVGLEPGQDGGLYNKVKHISPLGEIENPFAPKDDPEEELPELFVATREEDSGDVEKLFDETEPAPEDGEETQFSTNNFNQMVADVIPVGEAISHEDIKEKSGCNLTEIGLALDLLKKLGLQSTPGTGPKFFWWNERPLVVPMSVRGLDAK